MPPLDYNRAADYTEALEARLVDRLDTDFVVSMRGILGG